MSHLQSWIAAFAFLLIVTACISNIGDDDVAYQYLDRKPTPKEGLRRIHWVLAKAFTSIYGGKVLAAAIHQLLIECCSIFVAGNSAGRYGMIAHACEQDPKKNGHVVVGDD